MTKKKTEGEQTHARVPKSNSRFLFPSRASVHNLRVREESVDLKKLQNEEEETGGDDSTEATGPPAKRRSLSLRMKKTAAREGNKKREFLETRITQMTNWKRNSP